MGSIWRPSSLGWWGHNVAAKTEKLGPFLGMNNRLPADQLAVMGTRGQKAGDYVRDAVNVYFTDRGTFKVRSGYSRVVECTDGHSLWGDGTRMYYVDGDVLYRYPRVAVRSGLVPGLSVSYCAGPRGEVFWSNGQTLEMIRDNASGALAPNTPNPPPTVAVSADGALPAGYYMLAFAAVSATGEQSAPTDPVQVQVPANGRISISGISGQTAIFISPHNGDVLFHARTTAAASTDFPVTPDQSASMSLARTRPMPAGQIVRWFNGSLLVASGNMLFISEPYAPGLYDPTRGYVPLPNRIAVVEPVESGVFVCEEASSDNAKSYFLAGANPFDAQLREVLPYGAVEGTGERSPREKKVWWFSARGVVAGTDTGEVTNIQEAAVAVGLAVRGATTHVERDGVRQVISAVSGAELPRGAAMDYYEAEVIRKGDSQ